MKFKLFFKFNVILFLSLLLLSCNEPAESPYPKISFVQKTVMSGIGRASAVAFAINDKGYVALGRSQQNGGDLTDCWEYNPDSESWTQKAPFPGIARVKAISAVLNAKAYVGLGHDMNVSVYNETACLKDFWMFDPVNNQWTRKADFPSLATVACVSFVYDNKIYVGAGFTDSYFNNEFWNYIPETNKWVQINDFSGLSRAGAVSIIGDRVFFGAGFHLYNQNDWWEYFPSTDRWSKRKSMPDGGRVNAVALSVDSRYFVSTGRFFGGDLTCGHVKSDILEYDAVRNVWYERGNIPNGKRENAIAFVLKGKGYIGFGENDTAILNDMWSFEP